MHEYSCLLAFEEYPLNPVDIVSKKKQQQTCYLSRYIVIGTHTPRHPYLENTLDMPTQQIYVASRYITAAMFQHACGMCSPKLVGRFFALADFASVHSSVRPSHSLSVIRDLCIADTLHEKVRCCQIFFFAKKNPVCWVSESPSWLWMIAAVAVAATTTDWLVGWLIMPYEWANNKYVEVYIHKLIWPPTASCSRYFWRLFIPILRPFFHVLVGWIGCLCFDGFFQKKFHVLFWAIMFCLKFIVVYGKCLRKEFPHLSMQLDNKSW